MKFHLKDIASREVRYIKKTLTKARAAITPPRVAHSLIVGGAVVIVASITQWQPVVAGVIAGVFIAVYGLIFVDVDAEPRPKRRRRRAQ